MEFDLRNVLNFATNYLKGKSLSPRLDAEILLSFVLSKDRVWIYSNFDFKLDKESVERYLKILDNRRRGVPIAYIIGRKEFMGLDFKITDKVLVPRPETEELVERVILDSRKYGWKKFLDFGSGSGVICVSLAKFLPEAEVWVIDESKDALDLTMENAKKLGVEERIHLAQEEMKEFDIVVSNPPYLTEAEWNNSTDLHFEPYEALVGGEDGNDFYRMILAKYSPQRFYFEIAHPFRESLKKIFDNFGKYEIIKDLSGRDRIAILWRYL